MARRARLETKQVVSAGGVVYRYRDSDYEVLLLETPGGQWGLPKGTPSPGERLEETAVREVAEETGLQVALEDKVGTITYWFVRPQAGERLHKDVHFWLMRPTGGSVELHDAEHVTVRWFPYAEALGRVTHENTSRILQDAARILEQHRETSSNAAGAAG